MSFDNEAMPRLAMIKKAFIKERPGKLNKKLPLNATTLTLLCEHLQRSNSDQATLRAMLAFAYGGMLRVSEYSYGARAKVEPRFRNIVEITNELLVYEFKSSKTNQTQRTERAVMCCRCPQICAVHEIRALIKRNKRKSPDDFIFQLSNGCRPTAHAVNTLIKNLCERHGLRSDQFSSHCIRRGAISDALAAGVPNSIVLELARHKSADSQRPYHSFEHNQLSEIQRRYHKKAMKRLRSTLNR